MTCAKEKMFLLQAGLNDIQTLTWRYILFFSDHMIFSKFYTLMSFYASLAQPFPTLYTKSNSTSIIFTACTHLQKGNSQLPSFSWKALTCTENKTSMWIAASRKLPYLFWLLIRAAWRFWRVFYKVVIHQIYLSAFLAAYRTSDYANCKTEKVYCPVCLKTSIKRGVPR